MLGWSWSNTQDGDVPCEAPAYCATWSLLSVVQRSAFQLWLRWETNVFLGMETRREKSRGATKREGPRERLMGQEKNCGGSMLASDKGISVPPVGQSESLKL